MTIQLHSLVQQQSTTEGTGPIALEGQLDGRFQFRDKLSNGEICGVVVTDDLNVEELIATFNQGSPDTLTYTAVISSTAGGAKIDWGTGTRDVYLVPPATKVLLLDENDLLRLPHPKQLRIERGSTEYLLWCDAAEDLLLSIPGSPFQNIWEVQLSNNPPRFAFWFDVVGFQGATLDFPVIRRNGTLLQDASEKATVATPSSPQSDDAGKLPLLDAAGKLLGAFIGLFTGATSSTAGASGAVPAPAAGDEKKQLWGDRTWTHVGYPHWERLADQALPSASDTITVAHGFTEARSVRVWLKPTAAAGEHGWAQNALLDQKAWQTTADASDGFAVAIEGANIRVTWRGGPAVVHADGQGGPSDITLADWAIVIDVSGIK